MEIILDRLVSFLRKNENLNHDEAEIIRYGLEVLILKIAFFLGAILVGIMLHRFWECVLFMVLFIPMRSVVGGYHADARWKCAILSMGTLLAALGLMNIMGKYRIFMIVFGILSAVFFGIMWILAPVDTENNRLENEERIRIRREAQFIMADEVIILVVFLVVGNYYIVNGVLTVLLICGILTLAGYSSSHILS